MIDSNLVEGQITIQIVHLHRLREQCLSITLLVSQVGSEPLGVTDLKTESGVNA